MRSRTVVGIGVALIFVLFAIGTVRTARWLTEPKLANCVERDDRLSEFTMEVTPSDLAVTEISSLERIEPNWKFICERIHIVTVIDGGVGSSDWVNIRRTDPGLADDPFFGRVLRDDRDFLGTSPEVLGSSYIFREGCVALTGRHDFVGDPDVQERLVVFFDELVEQIPC